MKSLTEKQLEEIQENAYRLGVSELTEQLNERFRRKGDKRDIEEAVEAALVNNGERTSIFQIVIGNC